MTIDERKTTAKARREIINRHLFRDHGKISAKQGSTLEERYALHRKLHEEGDCGHTHQDLDDLSHEFGAYAKPHRMRVRTDRPPSKWTITWHLAKDHDHRVVGNVMEKEMEHESLHRQDPDGWAGCPGRVHRHGDILEPEQTIEYRDTE